MGQRAQGHTAMAPDPNALTIRHPPLLEVCFPKRFTVKEAVNLQARLDERPPEWESYKNLTLSFSQTELIDSSGLGVVTKLAKKAMAANLDVQAVDVGTQVALAMELIGLDQIIKVRLQPPPERPKKPQATHPSVRSRLKRALDIGGASLGLLITAILFPFVALAIQIESPGPVLFSQIRHGLMGRRFRLWKFRSMVVDAEARRHEVVNQAKGALFKNENDVRITKVGRFLRRSSIDELPQFWNVLVGDMSLIGTRPPTEDEVERYAVPNWQRFDVRPGMSGEWQVYGRSTIRDFEDVIALDLRYQQRWSLRYDLHLIGRTVLLMLTGHTGAV